MFLPNEGIGFWPLVSMGAILGGTMRSPFTGVVFALELTHDVNVLLPLLVAVTIAHGFTVLTLRRSILTEKVSRRGYHLSREYAIDPLEILFVREVMRRNVVALPLDASRADLLRFLQTEGHQRPQRLYPVVAADGSLVGVARRHDLQQLVRAPDFDGDALLATAVKRNPIVAHPEEPLRTVVYRMAETGLTRFPVVERENRRKLVGIIALTDLLEARVRNLEAEHRRERILPLRLVLPWHPRRRRKKIGRSDADVSVSRDSVQG
jgi:CBS domain-containing protein